MPKTKWIVIGVFIILLLIFITQVGFYTIQPIGAVPDGVTLLVWRETSEPFFNSPDAFSIKATGGVSLFSRGLAINYAPTDRIILKLPYWDFAYMRSTGGLRIDK